MTWIDSRQRWMKMYRGKRYVISCKALKVASTKEASYQAANEWWEKKVAEIDAQPPAKDRRWQALEVLLGTPIETPEQYGEACQVVQQKTAFDPNFQLPPLEGKRQFCWWDK
jgi:hypothetical protein